jgi:hypothetical protein
VQANLMSDSGILSISGVRVTAVCEDGALRSSLVRDDGRPIPDDEPLVLVTSDFDFLATGGDLLFMSADLPPASIVVDQEAVIRDAMASVLQARGGTLSEADLVDPARPRLVYPGKRPVRCGNESRDEGQGTRDE